MAELSWIIVSPVGLLCQTKELLLQLQVVILVILRDANHLNF